MANVELEHRQRAVDEFDDALGAEDLQRGVLLSITQWVVMTSWSAAM